MSDIETPGRRQTRRPKRLVDETVPPENCPPPVKRQKLTPRWQRQDWTHLQKHLQKIEEGKDRHSDLLASHHGFKWSPELSRAHSQAKADIGDIDDLLHRCAWQVEKKLASFESNMLQIERTILHPSYSHDLWLAVDYFSPSLPSHYRQRFEESPPRTGQEWFDFLHRPISNLADDFPYPREYRHEFFDRLLSLTSRMSKAQDCGRHDFTTIRIIVKIKLDLLHKGVEIFSEDEYADAHREVDTILEEVLAAVRSTPTNIYIRNRRQDVPFVNAAMWCREIRHFVAHFKCSLHTPFLFRRSRGCVRRNTIIALDRLQRHAYQEVRTSVYRAVGKRLPKELADVIADFTLSAEEVPKDPSIFDRSGSATLGCVYHKFTVHKSSL